MEIRIKSDSVEIDGYVNAIERRSKPLPSRTGQFIERICKGAFKRALQRNDDVRILLNHDWNKNLGGAKDGSLELTEDNIGLKARAIIKDPDVIKKASQGDLVGWSFGFSDRDVDEHEENGMTTRDVKDLDLYEVSLLDRTKTPAYDGTLLNVRTDGEEDKVIYFGENITDEINVRERPETTQKNQEKPAIDYSEAEAIIAEMKGE